MLDRLKDISSILIIPTAILYFLGFVCITSYLAQFEIVSFDVVNARYLIAGFYPLIGLIIALVIALYADDRLSMSAREDNIRRFHTYKSRFALYFFYLVSIFSGSLILKFLISLVEYEPTSRTTPLSFNPLGRFDIIGRLVERVPLHLSDSLEFLLRATIEVAGYVLFVIAVVWIARLCYVNWSRSTPPSTPSETHAQIIIQSDSEILLWQRVGIIIGDVVALSFLLILVFWSLSVLRYYRFDFDSLSEKPALPDELMFAWMYSTTFAMLVFLSWGPLQKGQISFDFSQVLKHPFTTPGTLQQVVAPLLLALFAFGATIFPRIPFALGGGAPRQVVLHSKLQPDAFNAETVYLIGESNQFLFIAQNTLHKDRALQVNKDSIFYIEFVRKNEK